jgi:hypothetical protein
MCSVCFSITPLSLPEIHWQRTLIFAPAADSITLKSRFNLFLRFTDFRLVNEPLLQIKIQAVFAW